MNKAVPCAFFTTALLTACAPTVSDPAAGGVANAREVFAAYGAALNSNNVQQLMNMVTDDIVWMPQQMPEIVGKKAAAEWVGGLFNARKLSFEIKSLEFVQTGHYAYERYLETITMTDKATGQVIRTWPSKGLMIYRKDKDGRWRVARDSFSDNAK